MKILSKKKFGASLKATIHETGKLGFTEATATVLDLENNSRALFGQDEEDDETLYFCPMTEEQDIDDDAFEIRKAGRYYYVNGKALFDALHIDYKNNVIMFDLTLHEDSEERKVYKLNKRMKPRATGEK